VSDLNALYLRRLVQDTVVEYLDSDGYAVVDSVDGSVELRDRYSGECYVLEIKVFPVKEEGR
jgi:hypothetical protein